MIAAELGPPQVVENLVNSIERGDCILFLGAGVHAPPPVDSPYVYLEEKRPPLGCDLAEKLAAECGFIQRLPHDSVGDLQRVSLCYQTTQGLGRKALVDSLIKHLGEEKEPSPALRMLAGLPFKVIVTTNYDHLFERALAEVGKEPVRLIYDPIHDTPSPDVVEDPTRERPLLFKIHGDLEHRESIVITDEDYIGFVQRMSEEESSHPVPLTVRYRMKRWPMLFVGFSLRDYNLRLLFRTLRWKVDPANVPPCFSVDLNPDPLILQIWQNERRFVTFLTQNLWSFVPWLYREVHGRDFSAEPDAHA
jgi:hypothetical protein